jgi:uncharacterized protein YndB with AHSA1/START domain
LGRGNRVRRPAMRFENAVTIRRPKEEVFNFLADLENIPKWNWAIQQTRKVSDGPVGVGTRYHQLRTVPGRSHEDLEVTTFQPPHRIGIRGRLGAFDAELEYRLEEGTDETVVVNAVELHAEGAMKLLVPLGGVKVKASVAENLGTLKRVLEGSV